MMELLLLVGGIYLTIAMRLTLMLQSVIVFITGQYKLISATAKMTAEELQLLNPLSIAPIPCRIFRPRTNMRKVVIGRIKLSLNLN